MSEFIVRGDSWKNYISCYTDVDKKELIVRMRKAWRNMIFMRPLPPGIELRILDSLYKIERFVSQLS